VQDGGDEDTLGAGQIDDPIPLIDQLAHVIAALGFGYATADLGERRQLFDAGEDSFHEPSGVLG